VSYEKGEIGGEEKKKLLFNLILARRGENRGIFEGKEKTKFMKI